MSIPLDRLYHYIESVINEIYNDNVIIYRFYPHGSKNINDLTQTKPWRSAEAAGTDLPVYCNDQEPLNFDLYKNEKMLIAQIPGLYDFAKDQINFYKNLMIHGSIYDRAILLHSEKNSSEVEKYLSSNLCVPVYYWCHAFIALDWFRYAQHISLTPTSINKKFLIYNRAWDGTREYRLKFANLLIEHNLVNDSKTSLSFTCSNEYYKNHHYQNRNFLPTYQLEDYYQPNNTTPCFSADFDINDYLTTAFEVVLETLFDDQRHHLTEKALRPIACGKPFILVSTAGSLEYLKEYGFKTFDHIIDESYDKINDPLERLNQIISTMKDIQNWSPSDLSTNLSQLQKIADYNKQHFFSKEFKSLITTELKKNLNFGIEHIENTNNSVEFIENSKTLLKYQPLRDRLLNDQLIIPNGKITRNVMVKILTKARKYYNKRHNK